MTISFTEQSQFTIRARFIPCTEKKEEPFRGRCWSVDPERREGRWLCFDLVFSGFGVLTHSSGKGFPMLCFQITQLTKTTFGKSSAWKKKKSLCCPSDGRRKSWSERSRKVSSCTECSAVSWYKALVTGQILQYLFTAYAGGRIHAWSHAWKELERNTTHPLAQGPPFSDAEVQIPLSMGEELQWLAMLSKSRWIFMKQKEKHVPNTNPTTPMRFYVSDQ